MPERIAESQATMQMPRRDPSPQRQEQAAGANGKTLPPDGKKAPPAPGPEPLKVVVEQINQYLADSRRNLVFEIDDNSGRTVIRVVNPETQELIREIPPGETRRLARMMDGPAARILDTRA